jgi:uncharacterized membrane protein YfcA
MNFDTFQILLIGFAIFASSIVQGAIGFAVALIAVPLFLKAGMNLPLSVFVVLFCALIQNLIGLRRTWHEIDFQTLVKPALFRIFMIPIGFLLMSWFDSFDQHELARIFGVILLFVLILQIGLRIRPQKSVHWGWTASAMASSGIAQGAIGTPGPPIAFWVMAHNWTSNRSRGTLFFLFTTGAIPHCLLLMSRYSASQSLLALKIAALGTPLSFLGSMIGLWLGERFEKDRLRKVAFATLAVLAVKLIFFS